ncbi:glycosyltransferase [Alkalicaulis satelles]|uniref:Glycosyltransferase n=1 Tax=Alkalicaulis satelles TaxID=2609175 RepID=A0A5M6ZD32_9PROT|nr:glycosyltransferase [Alkalicaulis satelles]KAA5800978.1 glycosyltransferase [Alkalicaulis satelles]
MDGTSPDSLHGAYHVQAQRPCAYCAAFDLLDARPLASAGAPLAPPAALWAGPGVFLAGLALEAPEIVAGLAITLALLFVMGVTALRASASVLAPRWSARHPLDDASLPVISVIIALHDEAEVVPGLAAALSRLDYPRGKLDIILALEAHDTATCTAARAARRRGRWRVLAAPPCGPTTKPRALNYALQAARGSLIAVYDAEDAPHPAQLRAAAEAFAADARLGVVQAPLGWYNARDNWLTRQFALEYAAQFHALLPLYARLGWPLPLGGTSNVFRRAALDKCGGWDPFNVTEDADLGFRLALHGWRAGLIGPSTLEEAPVTLKAWTGQRSRWLKGHFITWLVQMRQARQLCDAAGPGALACLHLTMAANAISALVFPAGLAAIIIALVLAGTGWTQGLPGAFAGLAALAAAIACARSGARRAGFRPAWRDLASMPTYWLLQAPAMMRALRELPARPYLWVKTRHGVSTARRDNPDVPASHDPGHGRSRRPVPVLRLAGGAAQQSAQTPPDPLDRRSHSRRRRLPVSAGASVRPFRA